MKIKKYFILSIPFIFILGSILHFTYDWSNNNVLVSFFSAINESVWEHTKLLVYPTIIYYCLIYYFNSKKVNQNKWFTSCLISLIVSIFSIPIMFYFIRYGLNIKSLIIDILIFLLAIFLGALLSYHYYKYENKSLKLWFIFIVVLIILYIYIYFTFEIPDLPLFTSFK